MQKFIILAVLLVLSAGAYVNLSREEVDVPIDTMPASTSEEVEVVPTIPETVTNSSEKVPAPLRNGYEVVARDLAIPWDIVFIDDTTMLVTERGGRVLLITADGTRTAILENLGDSRGEGGLLGMTLHPRFNENGWVYVYLTQKVAGDMKNHIERYVWKGGTLDDPVTILSGIPGALYHDGGRMEFGPDGYLYVAVGDATSPESAQDLNTVIGSILRITEDGAPAPGNPFGSMIYSYGHRNPQGLAWDSDGRLWSTEHGRSGVTSGYDEINLIVPGGNYGWPQSEGDTVKAGTIAPARHSGSSDTWAPASALYHEGVLYFGGLRGEALYAAKLDGEAVTSVTEHFKGTFGRIRTVRMGPDGYFYMTTSNRDGRGDPEEGDDQIIRIDPSFLKTNI